MASLMKWLGDAANAVGQTIDNVVPGNQSALHRPTAPQPVQRPVQQAPQLPQFHMPNVGQIGNSVSQGISGIGNLANYGIQSVHQNKDINNFLAQHQLLNAASGMVGGMAQGINDEGQNVAHGVNAADMALLSAVQGHKGAQLAQDKKNVIAEFNKSGAGNATHLLDANKVTPTGNYTGSIKMSPDQMKALAGSALNSASTLGSLINPAAAAERGAAARLGIPELVNLAKTQGAQQLTKTIVKNTGKVVGENAINNVIPAVTGGVGSSLSDPNLHGTDIIKQAVINAATNEALGTAIGVGAHGLGYVGSEGVRGIKAGNKAIGEGGYVAGSNAEGMIKASKDGIAYPSVDGSMKYKVSNNNAKLNMDAFDGLKNGEPTTIKTILPHKEFNKDYKNFDPQVIAEQLPSDQTAVTRKAPNGTVTIHVDPNKFSSQEQLRNVLLEERNHAIQYREGHATGTVETRPLQAIMQNASPELKSLDGKYREVKALVGGRDLAQGELRKQLNQNDPKFAEKLKAIHKQFNTQDDREMRQHLEQLRAQRLDLLQREANNPAAIKEMDKYANSFGEAEAKNDAASNLSQKELNKIAKSGDFDIYENVNPDVAVIDRGGNVSANETKKPTLPEVPKTQEVKPPTPKPNMSSKGLPPNQAPNRFARRVAADSRSNESLKASMNANGTHDVLHNADVVAKADANIKANEDKALQLAKRGKSTEANATALRLLDKYLNEGNFERADELSRAIDPRFTRQGQQMQILKIYSRQTPAGAVKYATHQLENAALESGKSEKIAPTADKITESLHSVNKQAAEQISKEVSSKQALTPEERLANRIKAGSSKKNAPDPIKDMVSTLHAVAKQVLPESKKSVPRDPMELIGMAVKEKGEYSRVYTEARKLVEEKYKDNPKALEELNSYFNTEANRTYAKSQLNKGVQNGLKDVDLGKLVREHYSTVNTAKDALKNKLIKQAGLSESEATQLSKDIQGRFDELTTARKQSILNQMFKDKPTVEQKSAAQRVIEMSNLGAFDKEGVRGLAAQKLGLPTMTPELAKEIHGMAETIQSLPENSKERAKATMKMMQHIASQLPSDMADKIIGGYKAGLLTGIKTQTGNGTSNLALAGIKKSSDPVSAMYDRMFALATKNRTKTMTVRNMGSGGIEGVKEGFGKEGYLRTGIDSRDLSAGKFDAPKSLNFKNKAVGTYVNGVFRLMGAADQPTWYMAYRNNLADIGKAEAMNQGFKGAERTNFIKDFVKSPTDEGEATATQAATKAVLGNDTIASRMVSGALREIDKVAKENNFPPILTGAIKIPLHAVLPFTKVPSAGISRVFDFTPVGAVKEVITQASKGKFDQRAMSEALGEATTGTAIMAIGAALAGGGLLSGSYPTDPKTQQLWKSEKKTENSILIGGKWRSLNYLGPLGPLLGMGATFEHSLNTGDNVQTALVATVAGAAKTSLSQSYLSGVSGVLDAVNQPAQKGMQFVKNEAASIVPTLVGDVAKATDSFDRQANTIGDAVAAKIPWLRENLAPKQDAFGNDMTRPGSAIGTLVDPLRSSTNTTSPLDGELNRLNGVGEAVYPVPSKTIGSGANVTKLTPAQQNDRQKLVGQMLTPLWDKMTQSDQYKAMDDAHKKDALQRALTDVNSAADRQMLAKIDPSKLTKPATAAIVNMMNGGSNLADTYLTKAALKGTGTKGATATLSPADRFKASQDKYNAAVKAGTLTGPKQFSAQQALGKEAITSKYSQDVLDFYGMSKADQAAYFAQDRAKATDLYNQAKQLDAELGAKKFASGTKYKYGLGKKPKAGKKFSLPKSSGIASRSTSAMNKLVSSAHIKAPKMPHAPKVASYKVPKTRTISKMPSIPRTATITPPRRKGIA